MYLTHGQTGTQLHTTWIHMRQRCNDPNTPQYKRYGGRGIKICKRWDDYMLFAADVGPRPGKGYSLDRINNSGDYEPGNVRWATPKTQARNTRTNKLNLNKVNKIILACKQGYTQRDVAHKFSISQQHVSRIVNGMRWA